ncbi:MBL fold metallo-hydrolase [Massilia sp. TS11]|uniref:MBL fold metallo-hydrolase n=1 Tax=Massilia sp. TS11 TaxID=2908003 RepID=UPI001EDA0FB5|nr:MBL fold metallo-hydrolase [Massilia sp. TS11]MCG2585268.1 MBL fold metallo-hydrolase [Massilia sp. TS11]
MRQVFERGWLSSNNVLFVGRESAVLVDSGYVGHADQTLALVRATLGARALDQIINTHLHSDHCGGNALLRETYGCRTLIPAAEADKVAAWDEARLSYVATGQRIARFGFDDTLAPGDTLRLGDEDWQVLGAPGHDPHSLMLFQPDDGTLIAADALWENGFGVVFPELDGEPGFEEVRATLDLIKELDVRHVIPGHGAPFDDVRGALARAYARLDFLAADPVRNAQNAAKVLIKFLLLDRRRIPPEDLLALCASVPVLVRANARFFGWDAAALADWVGKALVKAGVARWDGAVLVDAG